SPADAYANGPSALTASSPFAPLCRQPLSLSADLVEAAPPLVDGARSEHLLDGIHRPSEQVVPMHIGGVAVELGHLCLGRLFDAELHPQLGDGVFAADCFVVLPSEPHQAGRVVIHEQTSSGESFGRPEWAVLVVDDLSGSFDQVCAHWSAPSSRATTSSGV